jgi:hypothetical protein
VKILGKNDKVTLTANKPEGVAFAPCKRNPLYRVFCGMIERCENPRHDSYRWYGEKGVRVCRQWRWKFKVFRQWAVENGWRPGLEIDRINGSLGYSPDNCRWVTRKENQRNSSQARQVLAFGESKAIAAWAEDSRCSVGYRTLVQRLRNGWEPERAITTPSKRKAAE